jgi:hypothetical protein
MSVRCMEVNVGTGANSQSHFGPLFVGVATYIVNGSQSEAPT